MAANSSPPRRATLSDGRKCLLQPLPDDLQQPVADLVTEVVVDGLEPVEVEVEHRQRTTRDGGCAPARPRGGRAAARGWAGR